MSLYHSIIVYAEMSRYMHNKYYGGVFFQTLKKMINMIWVN